MISEKEELYVVKWEAVRQKGKVRYVVTAACINALFLFFLYAVLATFVDAKFTFDFIGTKIFTIRAMVFGVISPPLGFFAGIARWKHKEDKYFNLLKYRENKGV